MTRQRPDARAVILGEQGDRIQCAECGRWFRALVSHISRIHGVTADEYRAEHGIPAGVPLVSTSVQQNTVAAQRERDDSARAAALERGRGAHPLGPAEWKASRDALRERADAVFQAELEAAGWSSLADAVEWAARRGLGWQAVAARLGGRSMSPLAERAAREGLSLPRAVGDRSRRMVARARRWASVNGSLDSAGMPRDLSRWLSRVRHETPLWIGERLDEIDPGWRAPREPSGAGGPPEPPTRPARAVTRQRVAELTAFVAEHGVYPQRKTPLGEWLHSTRRQGVSDRSVVAALEALPGWSWSGTLPGMGRYANHWTERYRLLVRWMAEHGHASPGIDERWEGVALGQWVFAQRRSRRTGTLPAEQVAMLERLPGWMWDPPQGRAATAWREQVERRRRPFLP